QPPSAGGCGAEGPCAGGDDQGVLVTGAAGAAGLPVLGGAYGLAAPCCCASPHPPEASDCAWPGREASRQAAAGSERSVPRGDAGVLVAGVAGAAGLPVRGGAYGLAAPCCCASPHPPEASDCAWAGCEASCQAAPGSASRFSCADTATDGAPR